MRQKKMMMPVNEEKISLFKSDPVVTNHQEIHIPYFQSNIT